MSDNREPIVLESNQIHATITSNGICPTLNATMGLGGGYVPMIVLDERINERADNEVFRANSRSSYSEEQ